MKAVNTDVDIDLYDRDDLLENLRHIVARIDKGSEHTKHNTGVYFQDIPYDPLTGMSTIDYKRAEELGYMKIDLLNNSVYRGVKDEEHLTQLANMEPMWDMLDDATIIEKLFHIGQHADLVMEMKPRSVEELAMLLAVIRPGKAHLRGSSWDDIRQVVWQKDPNGGYSFKKSHAHAFAMAIVVQMNLMLEEAMKVS